MTRSKPKPPLGRCCPVMELALSRARDTERIGLTTGTMVQIGKRGAARKPATTIVIYFRKALKGDTSQYAGATYAEVSFCPFCGAKVEREPNKEWS